MKTLWCVPEIFVNPTGNVVHLVCKEVRVLFFKYYFFFVVVKFA